MEMINKNVSTFEALKKHAIKDNWHMDEVRIFEMFINLKYTFQVFTLLFLFFPENFTPRDAHCQQQKNLFF